MGASTLDRKLGLQSKQSYSWVTPRSDGLSPWVSPTVSFWIPALPLTTPQGALGVGSWKGLRSGPLTHGCPQESLFVVLQYLPPGVISLVNFLGPMLFMFLVQLENYPPNTEVNLTLIW